MAGGPASIQSDRKLPDNRDGLLRAVRDRHPELQPEDAFVVPAWFAQQKKWLEDPAGSHSAVYNYPLLLRIHGPLNIDALQQSLQEIVRRHAVLRSVFRIMDESLVQIVLAPQEFSLPVIQMNGSPEARELQMQEASRAEAMRPFDLARDPMIRGQLMRLQTDEHVLQLTTHTLVYDDWSTGVLIRELSGIYRALVAGTTPPRQPLAFQFGDFARWYQERLQGPEFESHLDYWKQQLDFTTAFDHLPADRARPDRNTHAGASETLILPMPQAESLKLLCRQERVSLFMVLLAGFKCLLHRYSGHEEIGVGTCAANRPLEEVEGLIGRFGNSMLLRTDLSGNPTFSELFKRVREVSLNAWSHQELPLGMLMEATAGRAERTRNSPFRVMFNLQNAPKESWQLPGLKVDWLPLDTGTAKLDLIVWLKSEPRLEITLEYSTQLFASASMKKLLVDYQAILETMAQDPTERVNRIPISATSQRVNAQASPGIGHGAIGAGDQASVEARLIELWKGIFGSRPIDVSKNFFELGGDSLLAARLFAQINKTFQCKLPLTTLIEAPTVRQLAQIICGPAPSSSSCLVSFQPNGTRPPLFCLYGNNGGIDDYFNLVPMLGDDQPVFGIRSPALEDLSRLPASLEEAAAEVVRWIRKAQPDGVPALLGYSWAGLLAFEVARQLAETSGIECFTAMVGTIAPMRPTNTVYRLSHFARYFPPWFWNLTTDHQRRWRRLLRWREMALATRRNLAEARLPVDEWVSSSISHHLVGLMEKYHPPAGSEVMIDLFRERDSYNVRAHPLHAWRTCHLPDGGWNRWVRKQPRVHWLEGDHWSIIKPPLASSLAQAIRLAMDQHFDLPYPAGHGGKGNENGVQKGLVNV
jgi:thioesterase domain-containing protein/acyl carrier protein